MPHGHSGRVRKISPIPGFDSRTAQAITNRYTDRAIPAYIVEITEVNNWNKYSVMFVKTIKLCRGFS